MYRNVYCDRSIYYDQRKVPMSTEAHAHRFIFTLILVTALGLYFMFQAALYNMKNRKTMPIDTESQNPP